MKKILLSILAYCTITLTHAQAKSADTVVIELAKTSKVVFTMKDRSDLETLKQYDFQALFNDMIAKLESQDTIKISPNDSILKNEPIVTNESTNNTWQNEPADWDDGDDRNDDWSKEKKFRYHRTRHYFNFDFGTNNFLEDGNFPDDAGAQHAVRPWGSWYIGLNSVLRTQVSKKFFIEWGVGVTWYNFKFQDDGTLMTEDSTGVHFAADPRDVDFVKSKLTVSYLNASIIPMIDFGGSNHKARFWDSHSSPFRIGVGPYVGYRIESHSKLVYKEGGDKEKDKESNNFYLNNLRYGIRAQIGVGSADFFFNYDLNELFVENKGPKLNAFSFGVIF
jgi:hypothetical protein